MRKTVLLLAGLFIAAAPLSIASAEGLARWSYGRDSLGTNLMAVPLSGKGGELIFNCVRTRPDMMSVYGHPVVLAVGMDQAAPQAFLDAHWPLSQIMIDGERYRVDEGNKTFPMAFGGEIRLHAGLSDTTLRLILNAKSLGGAFATTQGDVKSFGLAIGDGAPMIRAFVNDCRGPGAPPL